MYMYIVRTGLNVGSGNVATLVKVDPDELALQRGNHTERERDRE